MKYEVSQEKQIIRLVTVSKFKASSGLKRSSSLYHYSAQKSDTASYTLGSHAKKRNLAIHHCSANLYRNQFLQKECKNFSKVSISFGQIWTSYSIKVNVLPEAGVPSPSISKSLICGNVPC